MRKALFALLALGLAACEPPTDAAFGARVRAYLLEHPEVLQEAYEKLQEKQQAEARKAAAAALDEHRKALENDPRDHVVNPNGKITVVEFLDYNCSYCKLISPEVMAIARTDPDVRLVFKDLTIFGAASEYAAAGSRLAGPKYMTVHGAFMAQKPLDEAAVTRILSSNGIDPAAAKAKQQAPDQQRYLADQQKLAAALGIQGTPAFVIGDTLIPGADPAALKAAIEKAKKG